jgi:hypothetical protein
MPGALTWQSCSTSRLNVPVIPALQWTVPFRTQLWHRTDIMLLEACVMAVTSLLSHTGNESSLTDYGLDGLWSD